MLISQIASNAGVMSSATVRLPPGGARLSFVENFIARKRLEKRKTAARVCLYDFALNDFASVAAPLASEDAPLPMGNE